MNSHLFEWPLHCPPVIRNAVRVPFSPQNVERSYRHPTFALHQHYYRASVWIGRKVLEIHPGDVTITPPHVISRYELAEAGHHWCIHFDPVLTIVTAPKLKLPFHLPMHGRGINISEKIREIAEMHRRPVDKATRVVASASVSIAMLKFLLELSVDWSEKKHAVRPRARRSDALLDAARKYIDEHFSHRIEMADIVKSSRLSRNYFSAQFSKRFGMTVDTYIFLRRIEMAKNLLMSTSLPVKEIAFECGIADPNYFQKQFRRATGKTPTEFRILSGEFLPSSA